MHKQDARADHHYSQVSEWTNPPSTSGGTSTRRSSWTSRLLFNGKAREVTEERKPIVNLSDSICHTPWKLESSLSKHLEPFINVDEEMGWGQDSGTKPWHRDSELFNRLNG